MGRLNYRNGYLKYTSDILSNWKDICKVYMSPKQKVNSDLTKYIKLGQLVK